MKNVVADNNKLPKKHEELVNYIEENWKGAKLFDVERFDDEFWLTFILDKNDNKRAFEKFVVEVIDEHYDNMIDNLSVAFESFLRP